MRILTTTYPGPDPFYLNFTTIFGILAFTIILNRSEYTKKVPVPLEDLGLVTIGKNMRRIIRLET
jgi:hypothetical protein